MSANNMQIKRLVVRIYERFNQLVCFFGRWIILPLKRTYWRGVHFSQRKDANMISKMKESCSDKLFISNGLGGGTSLFADSMLSSHDNVWILNSVSYMYDFYYSITNAQGEKQLIRLGEITEVFKCDFREIVINSLVGYNHVYKLLELVIDYKKNHPQTALIYYVHDYQSICPHKNLVHNHSYCKLACQRLNCKINTPEFTYKTDLESWRGRWGEFLQVCNRIICFDTSGKELLDQAYPNNGFNVAIIPHEVLDMPFSCVEVSDKCPHVGIIGNCDSVIKGKYLIWDFLRKRGSNIPVSFIGTPKKKVKGPKKNTSFVGEYNREDLQKHIENEGINVVLFTSVAPETFSFVISEVMEMGLPIVCLNIGAQGHRVSEYDNGYVCNNVDEMITIIKGIYG